MTLKLKDMNKFAYALLGMAALTGVACSEKNADDGGSEVKIKISLTSEAPETAYPGDKVSYSFAIEYEAGIAEAAAELNNEIIEETAEAYPDAPATVSYSFDYTVKSEDAGQTLDFVVRVKGADGTENSYDVPLYVLAAKADIDIVIPSDAPQECSIEDNLAFTVNITSGNDLKSVKTIKDNEEITSLTMTVFENPKEVAYPFSYQADVLDVGSPVTFRFEVMDANGNLVTADYSVTFTKPASDEISEYFGVNMGYQNNTDYGQYLDAETGSVFGMPEGYENCEEIDIVVYYSGNQNTPGLAFADPASSNASTMFKEATVIAKGGDSNDAVSNWLKRNITTFKRVTSVRDGQAEVTEATFAALSTKAEIEAIYNDSEIAEATPQATVQPNDYIAFYTATGKYGIIKVVSRDANNKGAIVIDYKITK